MSSWKKASKTGQKYHKERSQLKEREHIGFLEKKKDYKLRAEDYQKKRNVIVDLKRKAQERNPDEFYFNMAKTQFKDGSHKMRNPFKDYTEDELKLMQSQDKNYIKLRSQIEMKKIEKLKSSMIMLESEQSEGVDKNKHRFFAETRDEARKFNPCEQLNTHESLLGRRSNRLTRQQLEKLDLMPSVKTSGGEAIDAEFIKEACKARSKKYKELAKRMNRLESLRKIEQSYELKPKKVDPEDEYDEKYNLVDEAAKASLEAIKSKKIIPRKR